MQKKITAHEFTLNESLRGASDEELFADLRRCAEMLGQKTITMGQYDELGKSHPSIFVRRFGSWFEALRLAGLEPSRSKIGITDLELFENIRQLWTALGRQPKYSEVKSPSSAFSASTYENRFGTWGKALELFVQWVNSDVESDAQTSTNACQDEMDSKIPVPKRRTKREISDRLRFKILVRDGFSCKSCGASPLKTHGVELHVDHILPWSKGGETIEENLETKCKQCNLGKGNAFNV